VRSPIDTWADNFIMRQPKASTIRILCIMGIFLSNGYPTPAPAQSPLPEITGDINYKPAPAVDGRGYYPDVWQLRKEVAELEPWQADDNTDQCSLEGDPDAAPQSAKQIKQWELKERAWLPVLSAAVRRRIAAQRLKKSVLCQPMILKVN
jgi:hypothetical protein